MPWFKVDDNLTFHAKVVAAGNPAMGLWVRAGSWCALQLTDGFIPDHMLVSLGTKAQAERLVTVRLWERGEGGYRFHEWADRQPSRGDVEAERASARARMRRARQAKKGVTPPQSSDPTEVKPQVSDAGSPEHEAKFERSSPEVREKFAQPDPVPVPVPTQPITTGARRRAKSMPPDFAPNDGHHALAAESGVDIRAEYVQFRDHHQAKGSTFKDWDAAFRTWLRNAAKFRKPTKPSGIDLEAAMRRATERDLADERNA